MFEHEVRFYRELCGGTGAEHSARVFARADAARVEIFARRCTPKKRVYSGGALGETPQYDPRAERVDDVAEESARRTVVHTTTSGVFSQRRRYVLSRRGDSWLVDNVQIYDDFKGAWVRGIL